MGKIVCLMGKSSTGKDTIFKELLEDGTIGCETIVPYTTRPIRGGEENGVEYFFTDEENFQRLKASGKVIEDRAYDTVYGLWRYFTVDDGQIQLEQKSYLVIGTLEALHKLCEYFGKSNVLPVLVEVDDGVRLQRALERERRQPQPKYEEMCRRFLADSKDFSEENIAAAGDVARFRNDNLKECIEQIRAYIRDNI